MIGDVQTVIARIDRGGSSHTVDFLRVIARNQWVWGSKASATVFTNEYNAEDFIRNRLMHEHDAGWYNHRRQTYHAVRKAMTNADVLLYRGGDYDTEVRQGKR